jgi:tRNA pseudouridine(55) synthase
MKLLKYVVLEKQVGETPLSCAEAWRAAAPPAYHHLPLAYAGRLDPMASGKLLVLIGDECKVQERYHALDKRYEFSVLVGVASDTADVLGRLTVTTPPPATTREAAAAVCKKLKGQITLPYPHFSAKTVQGKPLHVWTLEGRLNEIVIPTQTSIIYSLTCTKIETKSRLKIAEEALAKINSIPPVTDQRKALGNDFRRVDVRADWQRFLEAGHTTDRYPILHFSCIASSGTYMRSLAEEIGRQLETEQPATALAYHIHRTHIGNYVPLYGNWGLWRKQYR